MATETQAVEIIGHRGAAYDAPENTLAAIKTGFAQHADAVEIDVYLSKDGEIVTIHDENTKRTGGLDKPVVEQTLAELKSLDVGKWKSPRFAGERIPTLAEVIAIIPEGKRLFIEVKCGPEIVPKLARVLKDAGKKPEQTCVIGFSYEAVERVKKELPHLKVYWLVQLEEDKPTGRWLPSLDDLLKTTKAAALDGIDFGDAPVIDREFVAKVKKEGLGLYIWTVNKPQDGRRLIDAGVDGITTDRPGFLRRKLYKDE